MTQFIQARWFQEANRGPASINYLVIHSMESSEKGTTAESCARFFATTTRKASAHRCFDSNSQVQSVRDKDIAYHAPGCSHNGLGYEHAGFARQSAAEWQDPYSVAMLKISAEQAHRDCTAYGIPKTYIDRHGLLRGNHGITTHNEVSQAFHKSDHWDPGPGFPMSWYITMVRAFDGEGLPSDPEPQKTVWRVGDKGEDVKFLQACLNVIQWKLASTGHDPLGNGQGIVVNGIYSNQTAARVKEFEQWHRAKQVAKGQKTGLLAADGITTLPTLKAISFWCNAL
jgi:hypothetical protein